MAADWSTLPLDLVADIAMRMESLEDFIYFSAVCHPWNCVSSLIKHKWRPRIPMLLLAENTNNNPHCVRKILNPSNNKLYKLSLPETFGARCWGSDYGWLAMIDRNLNVRLFNPITKAEIHFPSAKSVPDLPSYDGEFEGEFNDADELDEFDGESNDADEPDEFDRESIESDDTEEKFITRILGYFFNRLIVLKVSETEFVIVVVYHHYKQLVFAKPGDKSWTPVFVKEEIGIRMFDIAAMDGYVFAVYNDGSLVYWNITDFQGHELVKPLDYSLTKFKMFRQFLTGIGALYLVQSGCDLLMVLRFKKELLDSNRNYLPDVYETFGFSVYRLDPKDRRWEEIKDHAALFVGRNSTMSTCSKFLEPNCIYFTDDEVVLCMLRAELGGHDMGVYDSKSEKKRRFYEGDDIRSLCYTPNWFIPQL